jgi:competence protein ComEA
MDVSELVLKYLPLVKKHWLPLSLGILGLILFVYGLIGLFSTNKRSESLISEANSPTQQPVEIKTILVDIEGAVEKPGLFKLPQESRIQDSLVAAGGLSAQADRDYISKNINLATKLTDGAKIYLPFLGEAVNNATVPNTSSEGIAVGALININTASESQLDSLSGIGPVTAQKIITGRPYSSIDELLSKKIAGAKVFEQIKGKISVY